MSYIGVPPVTGDFVILDTISTSATASYTLQRNSSNFSPESANHMLVSLNGSIQKPNSSFTVSGSTITFSSALTSSDVIDFILVLGNVNAVGVATTVSDNAITDAKTNFVSTSSAAGLQIKGDGTTDGTLALNCRVNSHAIKLKSPPHSASQSYTLTFPSTAPSANKFLQTDGSGNLSFADAGGNTPAFRAYRGSSQSISNTTATVIGIDTEDFDSDGCFNHTTSTATLNGISVPAHSFAPNVSGKYLVNATLRIDDNVDWDTNELSIYKNGSTEVARVQWRQENYETGHISTIVDFNGTSDYIYLRYYHARGSSIGINGGTNLTYLEAFKLGGV